MNKMRGNYFQNHNRIDDRSLFVALSIIVVGASSEGSGVIDNCIFRSTEANSVLSSLKRTSLLQLPFTTS